MLKFYNLGDGQVIITACAIVHSSDLGVDNIHCSVLMNGSK